MYILFKYIIWVVLLEQNLQKRLWENARTTGPSKKLAHCLTKKLIQNQTRSTTTRNNVAYLVFKRTVPSNNSTIIRAPFEIWKFNSIHCECAHDLPWMASQEIYIILAIFPSGNRSKFPIFSKRDTLGSMFWPLYMNTSSVNQRPYSKTKLEIWCCDDMATIGAPSSMRNPCNSFINFACPIWLWYGPHLYNCTLIKTTKNVFWIRRPLDISYLV